MMQSRAINRFVLDTNVIIAATASPRGSRGAILEKIVNENRILLVCQETIDELRRVLEYKRMKKLIPDDEFRQRAIDLISNYGHNVKITGQRRAVPDDRNDDMFVELAEFGTADCLVTADGDLLRLRPIGEGMGQTWQDVEFQSVNGPLPIMRPTEILKAFELGEAY